jgi:hypothetical protein
MNWYLAKLVFYIKAEKASLAQFDEQMRLVQSPSLQEAFLKARLLGIRHEEQTNDKVKWEFVDVALLQHIENWIDGMELCSHIHETEEPHAYIHFVKSRASELEFKNNHIVQEAIRIAN